MGAEAVETKRQQSGARGFVMITILALYYSLAVQLAATPATNDAVKGGKLENPFQDQEVFIAVLKCAAIVGGLIISAVQAAIYRFILNFLVPELDLKFSRHWFFVLVGLLPYSVLVSVLFQADVSLLAGFLTESWFRIAAGVAASAIYILCVAKEMKMDGKRAVLSGTVLCCLNVAVVFFIPATVL